MPEERPRWVWLMTTNRRDVVLDRKLFLEHPQLLDGEHSMRSFVPALSVGIHAAPCLY